MKTIRNERGMVMVAVLLATLLLGALGMTMVSTVSTQSSSFGAGMQSSQAVYVADGGLQYIIANQLIKDPVWNDNVSPTGVPLSVDSIKMSNGEFWAEYLDITQTSMTVKVTGRVGDAVRVVQQDVALNIVNNGSYGAYVDGTVNMNATTGNVYGGVASTGNFNHNNANLIIHNSSTENPDLSLPTVDYNAYKALTTTTVNGNLTIKANYTGNVKITGNLSVTKPVTITGILYVQGNVDLSSNNITVNGSIISEGKVSAEHVSGVTITAQPYNGHEMPAVVASANIEMKDADNLHLNGVVWHSGSGVIDMTNSDNMVFNGAIVSHGNWITNSANAASVTLNPTLIANMLGYGAPADNENTPVVSLSNWRVD